MTASFAFLFKILQRLCDLCVTVTNGKAKNNKHEQRLLRNMGVHIVVVELLQVPYEKVKKKLCVRVYLTIET